MKILVSPGHTLKGKGTGAVGYINESDENRILAKKVVEYLKQVDHTVDYHEVNEASDYLYQQTNFANKKDYDLVIQIHFNAGGGTGTETLYSSSRGKVWAEKVDNSLGRIYKQRGAKYRDNLYWLNKTKAPAILIETCFVDSEIDTNKYIVNKDLTAKLIAEGISNQTINKINSQVKKYDNCILFGNDIDRVGAEIISWSKDDCIIKHVDDHIIWEGRNLFVVGGLAEKKMNQLNNNEKYTSIVGVDRYDTIRKCLDFINK